MSWSDAPDFIRSLVAALSAYDWAQAEHTVNTLVARIHDEAAPLPDESANVALGALRRKRRFTLVARLAEALMRNDADVPLVRRHYAQALIDRGLRLAPELVLERLTTSSGTDPRERAEAHGLIGRIHKQLYVGARTTRSTRASAWLGTAITEYWNGYLINPDENHWHAVNVVALTLLARRDGVVVAAPVEPALLARQVLDRLDQRRVAEKPEQPWDIASRIEAWLALGQQHQAAHDALDYASHPDTDAFEAGATYRQLVEIWGLTTEDPPGNTILPLIQSAQLRGEGGAVTIESLVQEVEAVQRARRKLERIFGTDRTQTLKWYEQGLQRARSVARVEHPNGRGHGTGWLVEASAFLPELSGSLLLTNAHVVGPGPGALAAHQALANFQGASVRTLFDRIVWTSPDDRLDATLLTLRDLPADLRPIPIDPTPLTLQAPPQRVYIVGHPGGRDLEFSLHDNQLLACTPALAHYRTPTEGGSSGSPVFESELWQAVALHHAGGDDLTRLDNPKSTYQANEGIVLAAIQHAARTSKPLPNLD